MNHAVFGAVQTLNLFIGPLEFLKNDLDVFSDNEKRQKKKEALVGVKYTLEPEARTMSMDEGR